jgi:DNA-binding NtrC family response regulator
MNGAKGTVLVVDDEELVRDMEAWMLHKIGFKALKARNSKEACQLFDDKNEQIDLVILDMIMPDENGAITYKHLKSINPDVKVLVSTGYGIDGNVEKILNDNPNELILKPFKFAEFNDKIDTILSLN